MTSSSASCQPMRLCASHDEEGSYCVRGGLNSRLVTVAVATWVRSVLGDREAT